MKKRTALNILDDASKKFNINFNSKDRSKETVAEFLERGGAIKKIQAGVSTLPSTPPKPESIRSTNAGGPATIITMEQADLYLGEYKPRKSKKKLVEAIDLSALPPELRKKYVDKVINGQKDGNEEDNSN